MIARTLFWLLLFYFDQNFIYIALPIRIRLDCYFDFRVRYYFFISFTILFKANKLARLRLEACIIYVYRKQIYLFYVIRN